MKNKRILIMGIGGIGGIVASRMISAGVKCTLVTNNKKITSAISHSGIVEIKEDKRTRIAVPLVYTLLSDMDISEKFDIIFLIMKATDVIDAVNQSRPLLEADGYFVTFQNGIVEDSVAKIIGSTGLVSGIVGWGGTMLEPGVYEKTTPGTFHLGELDGSVSHRVTELGKILECVEKVVITKNIRGALWSKLAINCTINSLGAISGQTVGEMLQNKIARKLFLRTYSEVIDTALANDIEPEKIVANPYLLYIKPNAGYFKRLYKDFVTKIVGRKYKNSRSSSLQSLERGRQTEIDFLNGYVLHMAENFAIDVSLNKKLVEMVKEIEAGKRNIHPSNIAELTDYSTH